MKTNQTDKATPLAMMIDGVRTSDRLHGSRNAYCITSYYRNFHKPAQKEYDALNAVAEVMDKFLTNYDADITAEPSKADLKAMRQARANLAAVRQTVA